MCCPLLGDGTFGRNILWCVRIGPAKSADVLPGQRVFALGGHINCFTIVKVIGGHGCESGVYPFGSVIKQLTPPGPHDTVIWGCGWAFVMLPAAGKVAMLDADVSESPTFTVELIDAKRHFDS